MKRVKLVPQGKYIEVSEKKNLLQALRDQKIYVKSSCGGVASCSDCIIKIISGDESLSEVTFEEKKLLGNVFHITKERLSCQTYVQGEGVIIDLSGHDQVSDQDRLLFKTTKLRKKGQEPAEKASEEEKPERTEKPHRLGGGRRARPFKKK